MDHQSTIFSDSRRFVVGGPLALARALGCAQVAADSQETAKQNRRLALSGNTQNFGVQVLGNQCGILHKRCHAFVAVHVELQQPFASVIIMWRCVPDVAKAKV